MPGELILTIKKDRQEGKIELDHESKNIFLLKSKASKKVERILLLSGGNCLDQAELMYFINSQSIGFVTMNDKSEFRIQGKLIAVGEDDQESKGKGMVRAQLGLFNVCAPKTNSTGD